MFQIRVMKVCGDHGRYYEKKWAAKQKSKQRENVNKEQQTTRIYHKMT